MRSEACASRNSRACLRAIGRFDAATESSRSRISASAPESSPRASFRSLSAGTNKKERIGIFISSQIRLPRAWPGGPREAARGWPGQARPRTKFTRLSSLLRPGLHQRGAAADCDLLAALVQADMLEFDDPGVRARA